MRFISGAIKAGTQETMESLFQWNPTPVDDGWWVDDIRIRDALATPATLSNDNTDNSGLAICPDNCTTITANVTADPAEALPAPGQVVVLNASDVDNPSTANTCLQGSLQYQFWIDEDGDSDGTPGEPGVDTLLRSWTDNPVLVLAPLGTETYVIDVRCSTALSCVGSKNVEVVVNCPSSGNLGGGSISVSASGDAAVDFTRNANRTVAGERVLFLIRGNSPVQALMGENQTGETGAGTPADTRWVVAPMVPTAEGEPGRPVIVSEPMPRVIPGEPGAAVSIALFDRSTAQSHPSTINH